MSVGRPKENIDTLPTNWKSIVLELYSEGASDVEVKALIYDLRGSFSNNLWDRWIKEEPEFWETINKGRALSIGKQKPKTEKVIQKNKRRRKLRNHKKEYDKNRISVSQRNLLYYHIKKQGTTKSRKTFELFGYSPKELVEHIKTKLKDGMTLDNYGEWHIDHIKPLSLFDLSKPSEVKKAWAFENIQPLWADENIRKSNKYETNKIQA